MALAATTLVGVMFHRQVIRFARAPVAARAALKFCPEALARQREISQSYWPSFRVFLMACDAAPCGIDTPFAIAVSQTGRPFLLSGDAGPVRTQAQFWLPEPEPLDRFNDISTAQGVSISDETAPEYLKFFLVTYLNWGGVYLPSEDAIDQVAALREGSWREEERLQGLVTQEPVFLSSTSGRDGYAVRLVTWWYWLQVPAKMFEIDLETDWRGRIRFTIRPYSRSETASFDERAA